MLTAILTLLLSPSSPPIAPPNVVIIFMDDMGYGDVGCYGATGWKTPNLDRLAKEGMRFTDFYVAQPVCSASRAGLLTGCYPNRLGIHGALGPNAKHGIAASETTLAEICKSQGYATAAIGKWHLGHHPEFLPTRHGFDQYLGLPYSNDMWPHHPEAKKGSYPTLPLIQNEKIIEADVTPAIQATLTARYTREAVRFITDKKKGPFFLYLAHTFPHVPLFVGEQFKGSSPKGIYGDVIQELDWSVGEVLKALDETGVARNTLVIFTSDNGPWLSYGNHGGSAGKLREGKGTCWEGGVRVPCIARWPATIPAGTVQSQPAMTIDILPTVAKLIGASLPKHQLDGRDITPLLLSASATLPERPYYFYYNTNELHAVREGPWKLVLPHTYRTMLGQPEGRDGKPGRYKQVKTELALYHLVDDSSETTNVADKHSDVLKKMLAHAEAARADLGDSLTKNPGPGRREPGRVK
ncbi:MAG: sulfatase [Gemmatales bacterium]